MTFKLYAPFASERVLAEPPDSDHAHTNAGTPLPSMVVAPVSFVSGFRKSRSMVAVFPAATVTLTSAGLIKPCSGPKNA